MSSAKSVSVQNFVDGAKATLRGGDLTPLQTQEFQNMVALHQNCVRADDPTLQDQRARIEEHWTQVASTAIKHGYTRHVMRLVGHCLCGVIFEEYFNLQPRLSHVPLKDFVKMFGTAQERQTAVGLLLQGDESGWTNLYERVFGFAIEEFILDREHVELRLRTAANKGSLTESLLQLKDEAQLVELIQKDLSCLRQVVSFLPDFQSVETLVSARAKTFQLQLRPRTTPQQQSPSFWSNVGGIFRLNDPLQNISAASLSSARALLSDADRIKKTV